MDKAPPSPNPLPTTEGVTQGCSAEYDRAFREASNLATWLWKTHYKDDAPNWGPCDTAAGIISQIDNMVVGLEKKRPASELSGWNPIETCPKDGTIVLRPHTSWGAMAVRHKRPDHDETFTRGFNWMSQDYSNLWPDESFSPFWMPLPPPPGQ